MTEFYRKKNPNTGVDNFYETGTNRYISATEFGKGAGFTEQTNPTTQTQPSTIRTTEGGLANLTTPLDKWKNDTAFMEQAKSIIQKKQNYNKDIATQKLYWRDKAKSSPFFSDDEAIMRTLSPGEQSSVKLSRYNTAQSHLQGLGEEETYRKTRTEDIIKSLTDMMAERDKMDKTTADNLSQALNDMKKKDELGIPLTDEDYKKIGTFTVDGRIGTSLSYRNNNPGNLKYSSWQKEYGATKDPNSAFAVYPDVESAKNAYKALLTSQNKGAAYKGLSLNDAMWKWSGSGKDTQPSYTYNDLIKFGAPDLLELNMKGIESFNDFGDEEWNKFFTAQQKAEGWNEGTPFRQPRTPQYSLSKSAKNKYISGLGLDPKVANNMSEDEWFAMETAIQEQALDYTKSAKTKKMDNNTIYSNLQYKYGNMLSSRQIEAIMAKVGMKKENAIYGSNSWIDIPDYSQAPTTSDMLNVKK